VADLVETVILLVLVVMVVMVDYPQEVVEEVQIQVLLLAV
jgi:hypothetical protein